MDRRACIYCIDSADTEFDEKLRAGLVRNDIHIESEPVAESAAIALFRNYSCRISSYLRDVSDDGTRLLIAIAAPCGKLSDRDMWAILNAGVAEIIDCNECSSVGQRVADLIDRWSAVTKLIESKFVKECLIGRSFAWRRLLRNVAEVGRFSSAPVLFQGESGTGKEQLARFIHEVDTHSVKGNFVVLDCSTVVSDLSSSEFFGHERGAFTGAISTRDGAFALANGGTLFLDEIGELPSGCRLSSFA